VSATSIDIPQGAEFGMYSPAPPAGDFGYVVDDTAVLYGKGFYPFHRTAWNDALATYVPAGPAPVRLAPDTEFRAWNTEYVMLWPSQRDAAHAQATFHVCLRPQGMGAIIARATAEIDVRNGRVERVTVNCDEAREGAEAKAQKILAYVLACRADRRRGGKAPVTAAQLEDSRQIVRAEPQASA